MVKLGSGVNYHVREGRKRKHSVTGQMIDVTLRAVSSFLVLGSELGGSCTSSTCMIQRHEIGKIFKNMRNLHMVGGLYKYRFQTRQR